MKTAEEVQEVTEFAENAIMTYEDIDVNVLEYLAISELRNLALRIGVPLPMSKAQDELITEIKTIVEREMDYFSASF